VGKRQRPAPSDDLARYVAARDDSFGWRELASGKLGDVEYVEYLLTSQTWRGIPWKHQLFMLRPGSMQKDARQGLLFVTGGSWKSEYDRERKEADLPMQALLFAQLAKQLGTPVGVLRQVPFQPMFDLKEDALIAFTFDQYLRTGESDWPLLLPMVKSTVRAMDAMQRSRANDGTHRWSQFTLTGASKRGWTAWLTAATDKRVTAVVPMVIDVLNMSAQMEHQRATWGALSEQIRDYDSLALPTRLRSERGAALLSVVDPFSYRKQLTQSKLIILGTNDRYWPLDALNLYWTALPDPKRVLYVPNQGHGLRDLERVVGAVSAAHRYAAAGRPLAEHDLVVRHFAAVVGYSGSRRIGPPVACSSGARAATRLTSATRIGRQVSARRRMAATSARRHAARRATPPCSLKLPSATVTISPSPPRPRSASPARTRAKHLRAEGYSAARRLVARQETRGPAPG
jgi:PhoPQ-activated pathogenicity-related protein